MSFLSKPQPKPADTLFSKEEIEFLLTMIKDGTFKGSQLEMLYNVIVKLQNEYTKLP